MFSTLKNGVPGRIQQTAMVSKRILCHIVAARDLEPHPMAGFENIAGGDDLDRQQDGLAGSEQLQAGVGMPRLVRLGTFRVYGAVRGPQPAFGHHRD